MAPTEKALTNEDVSQWVPLAEREPPDNCPRLLITNNLTARDSFGHHSHIWLTHMVHKQDDGSYAAFDDHDMRLYGITHWRYAVPEDALTALDRSQS